MSEQFESIQSESKRVPGALCLADGTVFKGYLFGDCGDERRVTIGEAVFNTSLYGYQEIATDPSYAGQLISFTYPHIGNVGCNREDNESSKVHATGVVVRELCDVPSNFRAEQTFDQFLCSQKVLGITGIDTRALTRKLRDDGAQMGAIGAIVGGASATAKISALVEQAKSSGSMEGKEYVSTVTCKEPYAWSRTLPQATRATSGGKSIAEWRGVELSEEELSHRPHVVAIDCGVKYSILSLLVEAGFRVTVVPASATATQIVALNPDALFLSNGPGDPATLGSLVRTVKECVGRVPIFGICLGHQILGQVFGAQTFKLPFGHRGGNHPVKELATGKCEITVQNHGFAVDGAKFDSVAKVSHLNLNDGTVEGLHAPEVRAFSVQYHPESSPGPHDARHLFNRFFESVVSYA